MPSQKPLKSVSIFQKLLAKSKEGGGILKVKLQATTPHKDWYNCIIHGLPWTQLKYFWEKKCEKYNTKMGKKNKQPNRI